MNSSICTADAAQLVPDGIKAPNARQTKNICLPSAENATQYQLATRLQHCGNAVGDAQLEMHLAHVVLQVPECNKPLNRTNMYTFACVREVQALCRNTIVMYACAMTCSAAWCCRTFYCGNNWSHSSVSA